MKKIIYLFSFLFFAALGQAQTTGSFQNSVTFSESDFSATRKLYYYVPTDYDASNDYKLIVGFRGGPHSNAGQYRDQLQPLSDLLDAIIICPENSADFSNGTEENAKPLFKYTVETVSEEYSIDSNFIYITGLSYGGRHTIIASMDDDTGPISDNIRGIIPFAPGVNAENVADYNNSTRFPVCTCIGSNDNSFFPIAQTFHNNVISNGGTALFNEIAGIGHTTDFTTFTDEMMECFNFIEAQYLTSISDIKKEINFSVYPNPSSGVVQIELKESKISEYNISVYNVLGELIQQEKTNQKFTRISDLDPGVYFISLEKDGATVSSERVLVY